MSNSPSITFSPSDSKIVAVGNDRPRLQTRWRIVDGPGGKRVTVTLRGATSDIVDEMHEVGETSFPASLALNVQGRVILDDVQVEGEDGEFATQVLTYRFRNARETDGDVSDGLQRRDIAVRWVERQELIEHWAARHKEGAALGAFQPSLFQAWLAEPDAATRMQHAVNVGDEQVPLDDDEQGSKMTLAVAQRYDMGVQYVGNRVCQIEVSELWREPPNLTAEINKQLVYIPENHRPFCKIDNFEGKFSFVRVADAVTPTGGGWFQRQVVYLCVPDSMKPPIPPEGWGDGPIDELLNPKV